MPGAVLSAGNTSEKQTKIPAAENLRSKTLLRGPQRSAPCCSESPWLGLPGEPGLRGNERVRPLLRPPMVRSSCSSAGECVLNALLPHRRASLSRSAACVLCISYLRVYLSQEQGSQLYNRLNHSDRGI